MFRSLFVGFVVVLFSISWSQAQETPPLFKEVCFSDQCVQVELAQTQEEHGRGLQDRASLGENQGMLFIFPEMRRQGFWMYKTLIALDIIWMDQDKRIVTIKANVPPCKTADECPLYLPDKPSLFVLEVNAGKVKELGIKVGDQAVFR